MHPAQQPSSMPWPENPSPRRLVLTDYTRAYRVAQRLFERHGLPVAIVEQRCPVQGHCLILGEEIFKLELEGDSPRRYSLVTTIF